MDPFGYFIAYLLLVTLTAPLFVAITAQDNAWGLASANAEELTSKTR